MKTRILKYIGVPLVATAMLTGCSKFEETNENPYLVTEDKVKPEHAINNAIINSQMDPHIAERIFVLYWKTAGRQQLGGGISTGGYDDGWTNDYYGVGYLGGWIGAANSGVVAAEKQIAGGNYSLFTNNLKQISRILRAYFMSEMADNFGPIPISGWTGANPEYVDVKTAYYFMLDELREASAALELGAPKPETKFDQVYGFDYSKWQRYANSLRLRLAMRLSEVDAAKAKSEFEAAAALPLITSMDHTYQVQEKGGWDALTGVMTREWNYFQLPATYSNLVKNLGGIRTQDQVSAEKHPFIKEPDEMGLRLLDHFTTLTNDPSAGYWLDGLPYTIDPRAYKTYVIPGDYTNADFNSYPSWDQTARTTERNLLGANSAIVKTLDAKFTWNGPANGDWGQKGTRNQIRSFNGATPRHGQQFRNSSSKRIFFAPWETYFLLAEGAVRNWATPVAGKAAYETGIDLSFAYFGVSQFAGAYKTSTDYNYAGTSVSWDHITEPPASRVMSYVDGYTNASGTANIIYPSNTLYQNGTVKNDRLTKIITQKFIAQNPWLPLETWSDHRRLGLPFFENPAVENPLVNMPALNSGNYMTSDVKFFPQRVRYPARLASSSPAAYAQALAALGGEDNVLTPLWWAKH